MTGPTQDGFRFALQASGVHLYAQADPADPPNPRLAFLPPEGAPLPSAFTLAESWAVKAGVYLFVGTAAAGTPTFAAGVRNWSRRSRGPGPGCSGLPTRTPRSATGGSPGSPGRADHGRRAVGHPDRLPVPQLRLPAERGPDPHRRRQRAGLQHRPGQHR